MKENKIFLCYIFMMVMICSVKAVLPESKKNQPEDSLTGKWIRKGPAGEIALTFMKDNKVEVDFGNDQTTEVIAQFDRKENVITFTDNEGSMCPEPGKYKIDQSTYYIAFDVLNDDCGGRVKATMGFWTNPDYEKLLSELDEKIKNSTDPLPYLHRGRLYMAIGDAEKARKDFDAFIALDSENARVFTNRAGTKFPGDMKGVIDDCNKALQLDPDEKNAYFLRGLAKYQMGHKKEGCMDFKKAIDLGFTVLETAEKQRCEEYWDK